MVLQKVQNNSDIKPGFNGQGYINLKDYDKLKPIAFKQAEYSHHVFVDLNDIDTEDSQFWNMGIRGEGTDEDERIESFRVSFGRHGWMTSFWSPSMDVEGNWLGGRGRLRAAKKNGERWVPVAVYRRADMSKRNTITNGLIENKHLPQYASTFKDYIGAGVGLIAAGELKADEKSVQVWLREDVGIDDIYDNSRGGAVTQLVKKILAKAAEDKSLVRVQSDKAWKDWIESKLDLKKNEYVLMNTKDNTRSVRLWCNQILPAVANKKDPVNIIFYASDYSPKELRKNLKDRITELDTFYKQSYQLVNSGITGINIDTPENKHYKILGALPQIEKDHDIEGNRLVKIEEY